MKELDFDELDKAVNSLMSNVPKDAPPAETENTVTIPTSDSGQSATPTPANVSPPSVNTSPPPTRSATPTASLATRRGGRFMDMVHPSADMKKTEPTKPVSRQGTTIAPAASEAAEKPTPAGTPEPDAGAPATSTPVAEEASSSVYQPQAKSDWPDPLEMAAAKEKETSAETPKEASPTDTADESTPLTSPFLPNTKVEKRPLGSLAQESAETELSTPALGKEDLTVDNPDAQLPPAPSEPEQPLPEELQGDLVAIESGSAKDRDVHSEKSEVREASPSLEPELPKSKEEPPAPSGPTSIPKQYKEEPSSGEQESGAIYDTDTYHQPLNHPAKKKSGWLWVLWIVLILAAGASTGAALVFFQII